ncbi:MAG: glycoside hydrolase family 65 protein [Proteobacteria bacterium]|nr:glycoside hydrolase family 65 protein [Pseudomonadota bacterium]
MRSTSRCCRWRCCSRCCSCSAARANVRPRPEGAHRRDRLWLARAAAAALLGLGGAVATAKAAAPAAEDPSFVLTATARDLDRYFPAYLANGYQSTLSTPRGTQGTPAYLVAFMDYTPEDMSRPAAVPGWTEIDYSTGPTPTGQVWMNRVPLAGRQFRDYRQTLDLREATLTTGYVYRDGRRSTAIEVTTFIDEAQPHLAATRLAITPDFDGVVQLRFSLNLWAPAAPRLALARISGEEMDEQIAAQLQPTEASPPATSDRIATWYRGDTQVLVADGDADSLALWLDGRAAHGLGMAEAVAVSLPAGAVPSARRLLRSPYLLALEVSLPVRRHQRYEFTKYAALSREGWGGDAAADRELALQAREAGFEGLLAAHRAAWRALWRSDIEIEGDLRAQRAARSELYALYASSTADTAWPLGACALTLGYAGHAFWDNDLWIFPALLPLHPERARPLVAFRERTLAPAQARAAERHLVGAMFPWESDPQNGTEQTPHPAYVLGEREIHVTADVALAQWQYFLASGDLGWLREHGWPVIREVARFWASRVSLDPDRHRYDILHVASVWEAFNDIPNDTYTNAAAARALQIAARAAALLHEPADPRWSDIASHLYLPTAGPEPHHLTFDPLVATDEGPGGGSTSLLSFPSLDLAMDPRMRLADYRSALPHGVTAGDAGNSMGYAPNSIAAVTVGDAEGARAWFDGNFTGGTLKPPFNVRTETATNNTGYFLTGSGAFVQNLLYGFTGLRLREEGLVEAFPPLLPPAWKRLTLRGIEVRGRRYDITVARDAAGRTHLTRTPL